MTGIVLCGGQSSRMGSDKGLLKLEAKTWAQTALEKLSALRIPVKLSVNQQQFKDYATVFPATDLITDSTSLQVHGPLLGLLSCYLQLPTEDLIILACDMPLMEPDILKELYSYYTNNPGFGAYAYTNESEFEPLCGIYTATGLRTVYEMLQNGALIKHSMKFMLEHLTVYRIAVKEEKKICFRNFNAHAELNGPLR